MHQYKAPLRDMRFLINEVLDYPAHYSSLPNGADATPEMVDAICLLYTSPSPRDRTRSRMPSSA